MRITGGKACNILLKIPQNGKVRPAMDAMREQVFNRIGNDIQDAEILDGFAGSGAYGLEAISRGARCCTFLEKSAAVIGNLQQNILAVCKSAQLEPSQCTKIVASDVFLSDFSQFSPPNFIFLDPPYRFWTELPKKMESLLQKLADAFPQATLVMEFPAKEINTHYLPWQPVRHLKISKKFHEPSVEFFRVSGKKCKNFLAHT